MLRGPSRASKEPTVTRCLVVWLAVAGGPTAALAQPALTEEAAVRMGLARPALRDALDAEIDLARADATEAGIWPNPEISYSREQTFDGPSASAEDYAWISQRFDLSGRRGLRQDAAEERVRAAAHLTDAARQEMRAEIRRRFYDVLQLQRREAAVAGWLARMEAVTQTVARREAAGDASGYDRRRLERERASGRARLELVRADLARARELLGSVLGGARGGDAEALVVTGELLPAAPPDERATRQALPGRPEIRALEEAARAARLDQRAADRWWVPEIDLGGGWKGVDLGSSRINGFLLTATLTLPLFDRQQDEDERAEARLRQARSRRALALPEAAAEARGLLAQANRLGAASRAFRTEAIAPSAELLRTAEAAYQGGELGIIELLDAYRSALDAEEQALDLEAAARRARIELDRLTAGGSR